MRQCDATIVLVAYTICAISYVLGGTENIFFTTIALMTYFVLCLIRFLPIYKESLDVRVVSFCRGHEFVDPVIVLVFLVALTVTAGKYSWYLSNMFALLSVFWFTVMVLVTLKFKSILKSQY